MGGLGTRLLAIGVMLIFACGEETGGGAQAGPVSAPGVPCSPGVPFICQCQTGQGTGTCPVGGVWDGACACTDGQLAGSGGAGETAGSMASAGTGGMAGDMADPMAAGGAGGMAGESGASTVSVGEPRIPTVPASCPTLVTGNVNVRGQQVQLWVGARREDVKGSIFFYWHGTGSSSNEAMGALGGVIQEITSRGGMVASFTTSTGTGQNTANNVWFTGDFEMADDLFACAVQQLNIDTRRVYTSGCSAGGLQAGAMVSGRSSYLAGAMPNSGGIIKWYAPPYEDGPSTPSVITSHGPPDKDPAPGSPANQAGLVYVDLSSDLTSAVVARGGFAANCAHSEGHCSTPQAGRAAMWEFMKAHPFGVSPDPYVSGVPASFPAYCQRVN